MLSKIAQYNLERDKNVLGKEWLSTYGGYFSDIGNIQMFIDAVKPYLPDKELDILYAASASGLLGEKLLESLGRGKLTLVDISQKHLDENKNPKTEKICADLLTMDLEKKFDLIIMRSSLDYFPSESLQIKVLKILKKHLKKDGLFINQPIYISDKKERDILSNVYQTIDKIGDRFFQSSDIESIYLKAGFKFFKRIGEGKDMNITEQDHIERYEINKNEIKIIREILKDAKYNAKVTPDGYSMKFELPIFLAKI